MIMTTLRSKKERTRLYPQSQMKMIEVQRKMKKKLLSVPTTGKDHLIRTTDSNYCTSLLFCCISSSMTSNQMTSPLMKGLCLTLEFGPVVQMITLLFNGHCFSATISNTAGNSTRGQELSHNCVSQGSIKCLLYYSHDWVKQFSCRHMTTGLPLNNDFCFCPLSREMLSSPDPNLPKFLLPN